MNGGELLGHVMNDVSGVINCVSYVVYVNDESWAFIFKEELAAVYNKNSLTETEEYEALENAQWD